MAEELSEYEQARLKNIAQNQAMLRALGLDKSDVAAHAAANTAASRGRGGSGGVARPAAAAAAGGEAGKRQNQKKRKRTEVTSSRQSRRLRGEVAVDGHGKEIDGDSAARRRASTATAAGAAAGEVIGMSEVHESAARDHLRWAGHQGKAAFVGTASYSHTLHRIRSMSETALANRARAIERACGKHAVIKMRLFARVLLLEGYHDLAQEATDAYHRLRAKLGDPVSPPASPSKAAAAKSADKEDKEDP
eukprot:m.301808 g.301808  ORF g.301808 m.301808 type:complete len:249 (-) comp27279_c3_seq5:443-1189(-)